MTWTGKKILPELVNTNWSDNTLV